LGLDNGFFFGLGEGGGHIFGKKGNKLFEEPIETLLRGSVSFVEAMSPTPFVDVVGNMCRGSLFEI
jgi:hypothetical protein